jgi:hypothetical protein
MTNQIFEKIMECLLMVFAIILAALGTLLFGL